MQSSVPGSSIDRGAAARLRAGAVGKSLATASTAPIAAGSVIDVALTFAGTFGATPHAGIGITCQ